MLLCHLKGKRNDEKFKIEAILNIGTKRNVDMTLR